MRAREKKTSEMREKLKERGYREVKRVGKSISCYTLFWDSVEWSWFAGYSKERKSLRGRKEVRKEGGAALDTNKTVRLAESCRRQSYERFFSVTYVSPIFSLRSTRGSVDGFVV